MTPGSRIGRISNRSRRGYRIPELRNVRASTTWTQVGDARRVLDIHLAAGNTD
jgi:hypothetical protein